MPVFVGIDVAKETRRVVATDAQARVVLDRAVANDQAALLALAADLGELDDEVVVALDVTGSIATFLEAVLASEGLALVHVPGIAVNRAGQGYAGGGGRSGPRDARTIADLARTRPGLRPVLRGDATTAASRLRVSRRGDLVEEQTRRLSRLRQLLGRIRPGLERALDVTCRAPLTLLAGFVTPGEIRAAGRRRILAHLRKTPTLRGIEALTDTVLACAAARTIAVPGEAVAAEIMRDLATEALAARSRIATIDRELELEELLAAHPDGALIRSLPGPGPGAGAVLAAEFIANLGSIRRFPSADALAAAAGLAPVPGQSGRSRSLRRARGGDRALKRALFQSAFSAVMNRDPISLACCQRKRREGKLHAPAIIEGKLHAPAIIAPARRRVNVPWAMLDARDPCKPIEKTA